MDMKNIYLTTFIIYYLIATFVLCNFLFNSKITITLVNKKTKEEKQPSTGLLMFYSLLWIAFIPLMILKGVEEDGR